jgi:hypothetical protein
MLRLTDASTNRTPLCLEHHQHIIGDFASPRSCVMKMIAMPPGPQRCKFQYLRLDRDVERSRRLVGDQQYGLHDSVPIITAFCPPDIWCGWNQRCSRFRMPTSPATQSPSASLASSRQPVQDGRLHDLGARR